MPSANSVLLIDINTVKAQVEKALQKNFTWLYTQQTGSTNSDLLHHKTTNSIAITEEQTEGRGQRNNTWLASPAENLLFSIALRFPVTNQLGLMPLKVGLAIKSTLGSYGYEHITLKWPNDIFYKSRKLGGVLIESITELNSSLLVIGVGLNVNMHTSDTNSFISLKDNHNNDIDRTALIIKSLISIISTLQNNTPIDIEAFNKSHLFHMKDINFLDEKSSVNGVCQGINNKGQLLIKSDTGVTTHSTGSIVMEATC